MADDLTGQTLGQYRIEALLGSGGMGQVFRGVHQLLDRPAAIKVMQAHLAANPDFRARFLQEAKAAAALKHPNIVEVYDFGEQDGHLYLVMELMMDGSMRTILRRNAGQPLPLSLGLDLVRQAANGLAAAQALNMVHRDIKPDNLLLTHMSDFPPGERQNVLKISDFGLARLAESGPTNTGVPMGTLAYMSPEQCEGKKLDGRSDLYSLGVVLYEVITGYQPFQINNFNEALYKHINVAPPSPRQERPDLPPIVEEIILRCLAKKPEERYATGKELAGALQRAASSFGSMTLGASLPLPSQLTPAGGTVLQSPGAGATPPPAVSTLATYTTLPRVRVLDQSGQTLQVVEVKSQGLTIGRQSGNDIVLPSEAISRQHLQVMWDGRQVSVKDLGSRNGTSLEDTRLLPQVSQPWMERQLIHIGPFWLRLEGPSPAGTQTVQKSAPQTATPGMTNTPGVQTSTTMARSSRIGMAVNPRMLTITPGQPVSVQVTLTNLGATVDWFTTTVEGVGPEWVQGAGQEVQLNPNMQETIELHLNVARSASNMAGEYPVTIRARSRERPDESVAMKVGWNVLPFKEDALRMEPRRASGRGSASYAVALQNNGNASSQYELSGEDDEQKLAYQFSVNPVVLEPGREARVPLTVRTHRRWIGREQRQPFLVHARPTGSNPSSTPGEFVNRPLLPTWLLTVVGVVVAAGVVLGALFHVPPFPPPPGSTPTPVSTIAHVPTPGPSLTAPPSLTVPPSTGITPPPTVTPQIPGSTWTVQPRVTPNTLNSVVWADSKYVAVGVSGTILTSPDGISWTIQNSGTSKSLVSVGWTGSQFIAVGDATILTSPDGTTWSAQNSGSQDYLLGIASSQSLNVAVGSGGSILTSPDGITWTPRNSAGTTLTGIIYTGDQFIIVGDGIYSSPDGITWNTIPASGASLFTSLAFSGSKYVAVGGATSIYTSPDAFTWSSQNSGASSSLYNVVWINTEFLAVGDAGTILTSPDGVTWTVQTQSTYPLKGATSSGRQYVVVGGSGTILTSP